MSEARAYAWFIVTNVPAIMAGWFWLIFFVSVLAWVILLNFSGCTHEEFGIRCYPGTWYGEVLEISNFWLLATLIVLGFGSTLMANPLNLKVLIPIAVLVFGTAVLTWSMLRQGVRLARRWI
jgi:hypothetical protein